MTRFYTAGSLVEAQMLVDLLAHAGIHARIFNENLIGAFGELPYRESLPQVWLRSADDWEAALEVLANYEKNRGTRDQDGEDGELVCPSCGEHSPLNFELCWQCRAELES